jgi:mannose-6-phosphate isomerase-like protein (cupin superfamily)
MFHPPRHIHHRTTEAFYVIDGALSIVLDDREVTADAGSFVTVPPGVVHTFAVHGDAPARFLVIVSPPDFVGYFQEMLGLTSTTRSEPHDVEIVDEG